MKYYIITGAGTHIHTHISNPFIVFVSFIPWHIQKRKCSHKKKTEFDRENGWKKIKTFHGVNDKRPLANSNVWNCIILHWTKRNSQKNVWLRCFFFWGRQFSISIASTVDMLLKFQELLDFYCYCFFHSFNNHTRSEFYSIAERMNSNTKHYWILLLR